MEQYRDLLRDLELLRAQIERVDSNFNMTTDEDLVESYIYESNALAARYRFLLRRQRNKSPVWESEVPHRNNGVRKMLIWIVCSLGILMLFLFVKTGRPVRCFLTSTIGGGLSFWLLNLLSGLTGVALSLNLASAVSAVRSGAPGVCSLWLLKLLWK